jgi:hypothetical protein
MWRDIEKRLQSPPAAQCKLPTSDATKDNNGALYRAAMDLTVAGLACGLTRIVAFGLIQGADSGLDGGTYHAWEHDPGTKDLTRSYFATVRWRCDLMAYYLSQLDAARDESGRSLLDSSLLVWAHEFSNFGHEQFGYTLLAAGGANGRVDTGWHIDAGGAPVNRFHLTNMMAMGLTLPDIERNGYAGFGEMALRYAGGATKRDHFATDAEMRKPFPYLKTNA